MSTPRKYVGFSRKLAESRDPSVSESIGELKLPGNMFRVIAGLLALIICLVAADQVQSRSDQQLEYEVKAAFLYNFAKFVEWPEEAFRDSTAPITIGILGKNPFQGELREVIKGKTVQGRKLDVRRVKGHLTCHILFIASSEKDNLKKILQRLAGSCALTVSDIEDFASRGGIIGFLTEENRVRFEINVDAAERAGLRVSSKLLKLAKVVEEED